MSHANASISWPGVPRASSWSFPFTPGIRPSTCTITVPAIAAGPEARGTLRLLWTNPQGAQVGLAFPDCVLENPPISASESGRMARLPIKDRRHWWQFGYINGSYNLPQPDGSIVRQRTPAELATLLLKEMGEVGFEVSKLPSTPRPEVNWVYANPAAELDRLCQMFGCIVVLNPLTDKVEIWPEGEGPDPPEAPTRGRSLGYALLAAPESITIVGNPTVFESLFYCEPVGEDTDGTIKPLDDLSYKPAQGWAKQPYPSFIEGTYKRDGETRRLSDLAKSCVWKMYRVSELVGGAKWSPELLKGTDDAPATVDDIALLGYRVSFSSGPEGTPKQEPAQVYVQSWDEGEEAAENPVPKLTTSSFSIDAKRRLVQFGDPQLRVKDGEAKVAKVWLRTGFLAGKDGQQHRYTRKRDVPGGKKGSGTRIERRDLTRTVADFWAVDNIDQPTEGRKVRTDDNRDKLDSDADAQIEAMLKAYKLQTSPTLTYPGLVYVSPNGRIQQITWQAGPDGTTTTASAGSRHNPYIPTIVDQRRERDARELADALQAGQIREKPE